MQLNGHRKTTAAKWLFSILLVLTAVCGCLVLADFARAYQEKRFWEEVRASRDKGTDANAAANAKKDSNDILPEYQQLYERNSDMAGWLRIDRAKIDCPVMQTKNDPEHYLRRNFDGMDDSGGTPFVDYRCSIFPQRSFNLIVYGHYTDADRLFRRLLDYAYRYEGTEEDRIYFDTLTEKCVYELAAAFFYDGSEAVLNAPDSNEGEQAYTFYNYIELDSREGFEQFIEEIEESRLYETGVEISPEDEILTLVCCAPEEFSGFKEEGRFVIIAKKIS